jgi:hypothetical protein
LPPGAVLNEARSIVIALGARPPPEPVMLKEVLVGGEHTPGTTA